MTKAYVFGPINIYGEDYLPVYKQLMKLCKKHFDEVIGTYPDFWDSKEKPRQFYKRTVEAIADCDLFIGEVTSPSIGVGMEFQMAQERDIPCIALCKKGVKPSIMVAGIPCTKKIIRYENLEDLSAQFEKTLKELCTR